MTKELNQKQKLIAEMFQDSLTRTEFKGAVVKLAEHVKKIENKNVTDLDKMSKALTQASNQVKNTTAGDFGALKDKISRIVDNHLSGMNESFKDKILDIDFKVSQLKNGVDADEDSVADKVVSRFKIPTIEELKDDLPKMGEGIRDGLELLDGDERLDIKYIKGLDELIEKWYKKNRIEPQFVGGTPRPQFIDAETPSGTINGTNKAFTTTLTASPASSLKLYMNGQLMKLIEDYTLDSQTITFITAPLTNSILLAYYRL